MKFVPELEEESFQSMVAVPILAKGGDVIGVVVLHTEAPREFDDDVLNFLVHTASLVAGAIENAQLYEETRRRVSALTTLTQLSQALAAVTLREDLYDVVARGARELLRADACQIYRLDTDADELVLAASDPAGAPAPSTRPGGTGLVLDLMRRANGSGGNGRHRVAKALRPDVDENALLTAPLVARDEQLGVICCLGPRPRVHVRGRRAARGRGPSDRRRAEEGGADRAADRREHRQGHVRRARRGLGRGRRGKGGEAGCDLGRPAHVPSRRARPQVRRPDADRPGAREPVRGATSPPVSCGRSSTPATTGCGRWRRSADGARRGGSRGRRRRSRDLAAEEGPGGRAQRRRSRGDQRAPADARGRRRRAHRPLAGRRGRHGRLRAPRRLSLPGPPRARRGTARPLPDRDRGADRVRPAPGVAAWSRPWSSTSAIAGASPRAPGRSTCIRTPCANGSSGSSASPTSTCPWRICSLWSWR